MEVQLTLKEALESGKRFKRKGEPNFEPANGGLYFNRKAVLATDWEIEEERISLSAEEIKRAMTFALSDTEVANLIQSGLKKLGFK
jgi:hypothetical protein